MPATITVIPHIIINGEEVKVLSDIDDGRVVISEELPKQRIAEEAFRAGQKFGAAWYIGEVD